ncbi:MAG: prepilin peptidase [Planctomycetaceae bacterium]|nr:prepilin peptidase [Planctomycetaceae bacterium]
MSPFPESQLGFALLIGSVSLFVAIAAVWDLKTRRIPNWLTFSMFGAGLFFHIVLSVVDGWHHLSSSLLGFLGGFTVMFVLFAIGGGGAGDVKLMAALGSWLGFRLILAIFVLSAAIVAVMLAGTMLFRMLKKALPQLSSKGPTKLGHVLKEHSVTFAGPVALATWAILLWCVLKPDSRLITAPTKTLSVRVSSRDFSQVQDQTPRVRTTQSLAKSGIRIVVPCG